jgi:hypothetical protein
MVGHRPACRPAYRRTCVDPDGSTLPAARAADPNASVVHHQKFAKTPRVDIQDMIEPGDLDGQCLVPETKEDDAAMGETPPKNQLAKVSVIRDKNAVLGDGKCQYIVVGEGGRILVRAGSGVMTAHSQVVAQRQICALVQEKPLHEPL